MLRGVHGRRIRASHGAEAVRIEAWHERVAAAHPVEHARFVEEQAATDRVFFVLGMHRSGTSCLIGCLEQCGVHVGEVQRRSAYQPRGNLERTSVVELDEAMLRAAGGRWDDPPDDAEVAPSPEQRSAIEQIVAGLEARAPAALKDPRLVYTVGSWAGAAKRPAFVGTFRHPASVAASLRERNRLDGDAAMRLWLRYNQRLLALQREHGFPLVEFDLRDRERYCDVVVALIAALGLVPLVGPIHRAVDRAWSPTTVPDDAPIPPECAELYDELRARRFEGGIEPGSFAAALVELGEVHDDRRHLTARERVQRERARLGRALLRTARATLGPVRRAVGNRR